MSELESLRQEAETLKNTIRVCCCFSFFDICVTWHLIKLFTISHLTMIILIRMQGKQHVIQHLFRLRPTWNRSVEFKWEPEEHFEVTWPKYTPCIGEQIHHVIWSQLHRMENWSYGMLIQLTRCMLSHFDQVGSWPVPTHRPALSLLAEDSTISAPFIVSRQGKAMSVSPVNFLDIPDTYPAADSLTTTKLWLRQVTWHVHFGTSRQGSKLHLLQVIRAMSCPYPYLLTDDGLSQVLVMLQPRYEPFNFLPTLITDITLRNLFFPFHHSYGIFEMGSVGKHSLVMNRILTQSL